MGKPRVFLDSSVIVAALLSAQGGSSYILREQSGRFSFFINEYVFAEIQELFHKKFARHPELPSELFLLLGLIEIQTVQNPNKTELDSVNRIISAKDAPILVSAMKHAQFLLTLDNEFFEWKVQSRISNLTIQKPRDFIRRFDL